MADTNAPLSAEPHQSFPPLPPEASLQRLPFGDLDWGLFEELCERLAADEPDAQVTQRYGTPGQSQDGIDIYSRMADGSYVVYQCKRHETLTAARIRAAVERFTEGAWADRAARLILCTSQATEPTQLADEIEAQARVLAGRDKPVVLEPWGAAQLARKLKQRPDLVLDFFGQEALRRFCPGQVVPGTSGADPQAAKIVDLGSLDEQLRGAWMRLSAPRQQRLHDVLGTEPAPDLIEAIVESAPPGAAEAGADEWSVIALQAERSACWMAASKAWARVAEMIEGPEAKANALAAGAVAAGVAGARAREKALQEQAVALAPSHPRVLLFGIQDLPAQGRLDRLVGVRSKDPGTQALLECHRVLANLMLPDLDAAETHLAAAKAAAPNAASVLMMALNLVVQRGRLAQIAERPLRGPELEAAVAQARKLRGRLIKERRFEESGRTLMLGADALRLLGDTAAAAQMLADAREEELAQPGARVVLAEAAIRLDEPVVARRLVEELPDADDVVLIRAIAAIAVGTPAERADAVTALDQLVVDGGAEAPMAAARRLGAALTTPGIDWSDEAAKVLDAHGESRDLAVVKAGWLAMKERDFEAADALLAEYNEAWALRRRLIIARELHRGGEAVRTAADALLAAGPSQAARLMCAHAYKQYEAKPRAREVFTLVATDPSAPRLTRCAAFAGLMPLLGEAGDWETAARMHREWTDLAPSDARASAWAPTIAARRRRWT